MGSGLAKVLSKHHEITVYSRTHSKAEALGSQVGAHVCRDIADAVTDADIIVLAVKPQDLGTIAKQLFGKVRNEQVIVSILSGITLEVLKIHFGDSAILRMMPNVPSFLGEGMVGLVESTTYSKEDKKLFEKVFAPLGKLLWIPESLINAFTALAGSGPAFAYLILESMIDAGIFLGLSSEKSREIALQMFAGAIATMRDSGKHPGELKWEVTSPLGCTIAGVKTMEDAAVRSGIINTFIATYERLQDFET